MSMIRSESVNKKIRNAQMMQINYMLTVGDKEMENKRSACAQETMSCMEKSNLQSF